MFDSINLQQAIFDIFEAGLNDSNLQFIYEANKKVFMGINTPEGTTQRKKIEDIVLQGETFSSLLASVQVDSIGKEIIKSGYGHMYKKTLQVGSPWDEKKYLGFIISNPENNMANMRSIRNKSYGTIKTIFSKLNGLNLRKYYFESGMIFPSSVRVQDQFSPI